MNDLFNQFAEFIKPFQVLWNSARVTCIAVGPSGERKSVTTRVVLREEGLPEGKAARVIHWLEPTPEVLIAQLDFPKSNATQIIFKAMEKYRLDLETDSTFDPVFIRWHLPGSSVDEKQSQRLSSFSWRPPYWCASPWARNQFGEFRTCLAQTGTGDSIYTVIPDQLRREVSSKLLLNSPHFDGIEGLCANLLPGISSGSSDPRVFQVVFPLPLDLEQAVDGKLTLRAPTGASEGQMQIVIKFKPDKAPTKVPVMGDEAQQTGQEQTIQWTWDVPWPRNSESGKASLFYAGQEVSSADLRRWPAAANLRGAIDCYFDNEHKFLHKALFGENQKRNKGQASQAFEMAVVRLMNLLDVPLVWYGKASSDGRSDAAGLVDRNEKRVIVIAECTAEKPEAKFSALRDRAHRLNEFLAGEAELLPIVFTQADPPASVFEAATDHGIALVGRVELKTLFEMLSNTAQGVEALSFIDSRRSSFQIGRSMPGAV